MSSDPLIGAELGDYRVVRALGKGGMGVVYEAEDLALGRTVALKVLAPAYVEDTIARARFQAEIEHAVAIEHPHVVPVYAAGFERPHFFIAMRLIAGPDLAKLSGSAGGLAPDRALRLLGQIASALWAVHRAGMVHRDVKPHNVLVWDGGDGDEHAFLTDFGIAKALTESRHLTGMGPIGTPAYMAPEVCLGQSASPASDQYSLAVLAFELLAGELPYDTSDVGYPDAHMKLEPRGLAEVNPAIDDALAEAVATALAKDPARRHADVRAFIQSARPAEQAFTRSEAITRVLASADTKSDTVTTLATEHGMTDGAISQVTEIDRTEVVRLRRKQARAALVGRRR